MRYPLSVIVVILLGTALLFSACSSPSQESPNSGSGLEVIKLPPPIHESDHSLEQAIFERVSRRNFSGRPLELEQAAQLLWAAQGTGVDGVTGASRTAPSAGATHPMEIYLVAGEVDGLDPGVYHYRYDDHSLVKTVSGDLRQSLASAALSQQFISTAPASIVLAAEYDRTTTRYGDRGIRYVHMEVGHITQNIHLQCESLNLGGVAVGAFDDNKVKELLILEVNPLMIIPIGDIKIIG